VRKPISQWCHGTDPSLGLAPILALEEVRDTAAGLYFRGKLLDAPQLSLIHAALRAGEITGASVRMSIPPGGDSWTKDRKERPIRTAQCWERGLVVTPANPGAKVKLRSARQAAAKRPAATTSELSRRQLRLASLYVLGMIEFDRVPADVVRAFDLKPHWPATSDAAWREQQRRARRVLSANPPTPPRR
jgi:hypothetical protein